MAGVVVGTSGTTGFARRWKNGTWIELSPQGFLPDGVSIPNAVNADGRLAVGMTFWEAIEESAPTGWVNGEARIVLPDPWSPYFTWDGDATAVTPDGSFVAGHRTIFDELGWTMTAAFRCCEDPYSFEHDIIEVDPTRCYPYELSAGSQAFAMSADGQVIAVAELCVDYYVHSLVRKEFLLWVNGAMVESPLSSIYALSADGSIAAGIDAYWPAYAEDGVVTQLGALPGGTGYGYATAMSQDGSIIAGRANGPLGYEAFIWDAEHGIRSLRDVLIGLGVNITGWQLTQVTGVSYDGLVIVGNGTDPSSRTQGCVADLRPPEQLPSLSPATAGILFAGLLGAGAAALLRRTP
jgi:uncharacterized membrane protein